MLLAGCGDEQPPVTVSANEVEDYLYDIIDCHFESDAIHTDAYLFLRWGSDNKEAMRTAVEKGLEASTALKDRAQKMAVPERFEALHKTFLTSVDALQAFYRAVLRGESKNICKEGFQRYASLRGKHLQMLDAAKKEEFGEYAKPHDYYLEMIWSKDGGEKVRAEIEKGERIVTGLSRKDSREYLAVLSIFDEGELVKAYQTFEALRKSLKGTSIEHNCLVKMADCVLKMYEQPAKFPGVDPKQGFQYLEQVVNSGIYSSVLAEAFYKWRTANQSLHFGVSNYSRIPNKIYNKKRTQLIKITRLHLRKHPENGWTREQLSILRNLHNIYRGSPCGNTNLSDWGFLFMSPASEGNISSH